MTTAQPVPSSPLAAIAAATRALPRSVAIYAAFATATCVLFWPTLSAMARTWLESSAYHHGILVAPIALWMASRGGIASGSRPSLVALPAIALAAAILILGRAASINVVEQIGFVSLLIAGAAAILGWTQFRRSAFPLFFLYFMVPLDGALTPSLQRLTADGAVALLNATGVKAAIEGLLISTSSGNYLIAEACSGLNFLLAALMIAAIYAWIAFAGWRKRALFLVFALALAVVANIARAYLVIAAATLTAGRYSIGADHIVFGWAFYGALLFVLVIVGTRFADVPSRRPAEVVDARSLTALGMAAIAGAFVIAAAAGAYASLVVDRAPASTLPAALPYLNAPGWRASAPYESWRASLRDADRVLHASYQKGALAVQTSLGYFAYDRSGAEIAGYSSRADDAEWRRTGSRAVEANAFGERRTFTVETLEDQSGQTLQVAVFYWYGGKFFESRKVMRKRIAIDRLSGRGQRGGAMYVAAALRNGDDWGLEPFLASVEPLPAWLARVDAKLSN